MLSQYMLLVSRVMLAARTPVCSSARGKCFPNPQPTATRDDAFQWRFILPVRDLPCNGHTFKLSMPLHERRGVPFQVY
jgi:hypothetical protein